MPASGLLIVGIIKTPPNGTVASAPKIIVVAPPTKPPIAVAMTPRTISFITKGITPSTMLITPIGTADFNVSTSSFV